MRNTLYELKTRLMKIANDYALHNAEALSSRTLKKNYIAKCNRIFELILDKISTICSLNGVVINPENFRCGAEIKSSEFKLIDRMHYFNKLKQMRNDGLIHFRLSNSGLGVQQGSRTKKGDNYKGKTVSGKGANKERFYGKYYLGESISSNIKQMLEDETFVPEIVKPETTVEAEMEDKIDKDIKRANNLLTNLKQVNDNIWSSYISDDIPVPIQDFKVKEFMEKTQRRRLHGRLERIHKKMRHDLTEQTTEKVYDYDHNPWWQHLTLHNDKQLLTECPYFGQWTDGRSHSRFHSLPSLKKVKDRVPNVVYREDILLCGEKMEEVFDIPHAFPLLLAYVLKDNPKVDKVELERYNQEVWNLDRTDDIYCHILQDAGIDPFKQIEITDDDTGKKKLSTNRDEVKKVVQMWIYSDVSKKAFMKMKVKFYEAVSTYYEKNFPTIADTIYDWPIELRNYIDGNFSIKKKPIRMICHDFQKLERKVSIGLCSLIDVPYQPLYDAIYVRKKDVSRLNDKIDFIAEMKKILEK